jgi:hypothetical protein
MGFPYHYQHRIVCCKSATVTMEVFSFQKKKTMEVFWLVVTSCSHPNQARGSPAQREREQLGSRHEPSRRTQSTRAMPYGMGCSLRGIFGVGPFGRPRPGSLGGDATRARHACRAEQCNSLMHLCDWTIAEPSAPAVLPAPAPSPSLPSITTAINHSCYNFTRPPPIFFFPIFSHRHRQSIPTEYMT